MRKFLFPIYEYIFANSFYFYFLESRTNMQNMVYLAQEMGVPMGNYGFSWFGNHIYSQKLHEDIYGLQWTDVRGDISSLSTDNQIALLRLKNALEVPANSPYSIEQWCTCLASIRYLRQSVLPRSSSDNKVLSELLKRNPLFTDDASNKEAIAREKILLA